MPPEHQRLLGAIAADVPRYQLPDTLFRHVSPVDTPSGLLAIIDLPQSAAPAPLTDSVVVLDAVQDPGNLGTILRTAAAAGIGRVLLGAGCAQAWSPRVLRAGMGRISCSRSKTASTLARGSRATRDAVSPPRWARARARSTRSTCAVRWPGCSAPKARACRPPC
jgi:rRNA methylases